MNRAGRIALVLLATATAAAHAQEARRRVERPMRPELGSAFAVGRGEPMGRAGGVEQLMRRKEQLKLTDSQLSLLEAIRKEQVARRQEQSRETIDLESRLAAGQLEPTEARKRFEERGEKLRIDGEKDRDRVEKILTVEQREQLRQDMREGMMQGRMRGVMPMRPGMAPGRGQMMPGARFREPMPPMGRGRMMPGARFRPDPRFEQAPRFRPDARFYGEEMRMRRR